MTQRFVAILIAVFFLGLIAVMASVTFFVRDPLPIASPRMPVTLAAEGPGPAAGAEVSLDGSYRFDILITLRPSAARPEVALVHPASGGQPVLPDLSEPAPGQLRATGQFTAHGRWEILIEGGQARQSLPFILRE
ncbi:hypothetical protein [Alkalilacustris brevis]|uniref:hypothetical protein n=1 Tax=Alkalilacustris brevis TaxID=2026338 RepID=UPI0012D3231F|nr:hypothetical protein [Alkalilacustris brevis]